ncbi:MAG TPA: ribosomal protein L7/L12 [Longimicrobium sp.]
MSRGKLLLIAGVAAFVAIMLAGPGAAVFPSTLHWGAWAACPDGTTPAHRRFRESYNRPGETQVAFYCVAPDGTEHERTLAAMGGLFLMYFMGGCVVLSLLSRRIGAAPADATRATSSTPRAVPGDVEAKARALLARDQKIHAIKLVREATGMGLAEAKDWVEALPLRPPSSPPPTLLAPAGSASNRLAELKRMLDAGLITQSEYDQKKSEILAEL